MNLGFIGTPRKWPRIESNKPPVLSRQKRRMRQIRGAKAQMGLPLDAPLPGKTLRRLIRSGAPGSMGPDTFLLEQTFLSAPMIY